MGKYNVTLYNNNVMPTINFNFVTNNITGFKLTQKLTNQIIWLFYIKTCSTSGAFFAQETYLTKGIEQEWKDELNGQILSNRRAC